MKNNPIEDPGSKLNAALKGNDQPPFHVYIDAIVSNGKLLDRHSKAPLCLKEGTIVSIKVSCHEAFLNRLWTEPELIPFLPCGTRIFFGAKRRHVTAMEEGMKVWDEEFVPLFTLDKNEPIRLRFRGTSPDYLWTEMILKENLWLMSRRDRPAKLMPCAVEVPALEEVFFSLNAAATECIRLTQPTRRSTSANVFRCCLIVEGTTLNLLDWAREDAVARWKGGQDPMGFADEKEYLGSQRKHIARHREMGRP